MRNALIGAGVGGVLVLVAAIIFLSPSEQAAMVQTEDSTVNAARSNAASIYQSKYSSLPEHQLYCIPEKKSACSLEGCKPVDANVFVLLNETSSGVAMYRCDDKPCDAYPSTADIGGATMEIRTIDNHGILFKTSTLDQSYVEVVTLGTDTLVSHGYCYKNE